MTRLIASPEIVTTYAVAGRLSFNPPAGPWLRYRGHLDKFSENLLEGGTNAWTGERGRSRNALTGQAGQPVGAEPDAQRRLNRDS